MKTPKNIDNPKQGMFLQYFLIFGLTFGGASTTLFAFMAITPQRAFELEEGIKLAVVVITTTLIMVALGFSLGSKLFRWYNTELAIRQAIDAHTAFEDNLMIDRRERYGAIMAATGGCLAAISSLIDDYWTVAGRIVAGLCLLLFVATLIGAIIMAVISFRLYRERRSEGNPQIIIWYRYEEIEGVKVKTHLVLPASEAPSLYW